MSQYTIYQKIKKATEIIQKKYEKTPQIGMVLGSGLGPIADAMTNTVVIPYSEIPFFHGTSVEGHSGEMVLGDFNGVSCVCLKGRFHYYEGYPMDDVVFPTRVACALGIHTFLLTAAAGGINTRFQPGDVMIITDHINLMGDNPLKGPHLAELGPRFPDMTEAYHPQCRQVFSDSAAELKIAVQEGVYAGMTGPTYETPAEIKMLRTIGADACGMSTVPESIAANHLGVRVAGLCSITNLAAGMSPAKLSHKEVMDTSHITVDKIRKILEHSITKLANK